MSLLLAASNLGTSTAVAVMSKDQYIRKPTSNDQDVAQPMMTNSDGDVLAVVKSETRLPLYAAPVVPMAKLKTVESLEVSFFEGDVNEGIVNVKASLKVGDVKVYSPTSAVFELSSGGSVRIRDGGVTYVDSTGDEKPLCEADMNCAAFSVGDAVEAEVLLAEADAALAAVGVTVGAGRRLASACKTFVQVATRKIICAATGFEQFCLGGDGGNSARTAKVQPVGASSFCTTLTDKVDLTAQGLWCGDVDSVDGATCDNSFTHYYDADLAAQVYSPCGVRDGACRLLNLEAYFQLYLLEYCDASCTEGPGGDCVNVFTQCCDYDKNCAPCSDVLS